MLTRSLRQFRRGMWHDLVLGIVRTFGSFDISILQIATLFLLEDEESEPTIKRVAELLRRSVSTTSRLLDQLVERGLVSRREDERDRRIKRVAITENGRVLMTVFEQQRADAQLAVMGYLSAEERIEVARVMILLAEAGKRRRLHEHREFGTTKQRSDE
ncbi:MAG: MarR family transcriptional regulator [Chloroflexota bacterium]|nr:MarR family transcriptional regulator [Chloroflexota bacterium]